MFIFFYTFPHILIHITYYPILNNIQRQCFLTGWYPIAHILTPPHTIITVFLSRLSLQNIWSLSAVIQQCSHSDSQSIRIRDYIFDITTSQCPVHFMDSSRTTFNHFWDVLLLIIFYVLTFIFFKFSFIVKFLVSKCLIITFREFKYKRKTWKD